jgi:hypothetical protein
MSTIDKGETELTSKLWRRLKKPSLMRRQSDEVRMQSK